MKWSTTVCTTLFNFGNNDNNHELGFMQIMQVAFLERSFFELEEKFGFTYFNHIQNQQMLLIFNTYGMVFSKCQKWI